jgi:hypothetical protein
MGMTPRGHCSLRLSTRRIASFSPRAVVLLATGALLFFVSPSSRPACPPCELCGTVTAEEDESIPLENVVIKLYDGQRQFLRTLLTGTTGYYYYTVSQSGQYYLSVETEKGEIPSMTFLRVTVPPSAACP